MLYLVMPVYNEEASVARVFDEWMPVLFREAKDFRWLVLNDGSTDGTLEILRGYAHRYPQIEVIDKPNSGHGQTCLMGYRMALQSGAEWVFQLDSDGQCDPRYFAEVWAKRSRYPVIMGYRRVREDGASRWWVSRVVSLCAWAVSRVWVKDANVPYRLVRRDVLEAAAHGIPDDFNLVNILMSIRMRSRETIAWVPIVFRDRFGGSSTVKASALLRHGRTLLAQLRREKSRGLI